MNPITPEQREEINKYVSMMRFNHFTECANFFDAIISSEQAWKKEYADERAAHNSHVTELLQKEQQLKQAVEVLEWYANQRNHERDIDAFKVLPSNAMEDEGQRAKEFLSSLPQGTKEG